MQLNALEFFPFLAIVLIAVRLVRPSSRWFVLLTASFVFYAWGLPPYLPFALLVVITTTYFAGRWMHAAQSAGTKRALLIGGVVANLAVLVGLRYVPFILSGVTGLLGIFNVDVSAPHMEVLSAVGVSYFVFQAISYLADIYLETLEPETHFGRFALYLSFFPKVLQGPIERGGRLLPQLHRDVRIEYDNLRFGILLFTWGLFKKVVIADRLGLYVDACYGDVESFHGASLILATYLYGFQLYLDFSGYTDMAIGCARMFNITLSPNFRDPYMAGSIVEFWRRWHMTLSTWILDYIFRPLQIRWRNMAEAGTAAALFVTFVICGLWHGPTAGFLLFGVIHGIYMASSSIYTPWERRFLKSRGIRKGALVRGLEVVLTFNLVSFSWIFFRANNIDDAWYIVRHVLDGFDVFSSGLLQSQGVPELIVTLILSACALIVSYNIDRGRDLFLRSTPFRWSVYYTLALTILAFGRLGESDFLYFRF